MTAPYRRTSETGLLGNHETRIGILEAVPSAADTCGVWVEPTLLNGWSNAGPPYDSIAYRLCGDTLEFKGHITGGASGTIAFVLGGIYLPEFDLSTCTDTTDATTSVLGVAQIYVTASTGAVTVTVII